jgi:hypothetical protein
VGTKSQKLPAIPKRRRSGTGTVTGPKGAAAPSTEKQPDLSHIATELRPLARPLADIAFLATNAYEHPEQQVEKLKGMLESRGQLELLVVNKRTSPPTVIGGNGRLSAMLSLGWTHAAYHFIDVDEAEAEAISLELNGASDGRVVVPAKLLAMLDRVKAAKVKLSPRVGEMMEDLRERHGPKPPTPPAAAKPDVTYSCPACGHQWG